MSFAALPTTTCLLLSGSAPRAPSSPGLCKQLWRARRPIRGTGRPQFELLDADRVYESLTSDSRRRKAFALRSLHSKRMLFKLTQDALLR
jgi:hypothetical protein